MRWRQFLLVIALASMPASGQSFAQQPTYGLFGEMAYTLSQGEWMVGPLALPFVLEELAAIQLNFGLTDSLQLGTYPLFLLGGTLNLTAKYRLPLVQEASWAFLFHLATTLEIFTVGVGGVGSWQIEGLGWHIGAQSWFGDQWGISVYGIGDWQLQPWLWLLGEVGFPPLLVWAGALVQVELAAAWVQFIEARASVGVEPFADTFTSRLEFTFRFFPPG